MNRVALTYKDYAALPDDGRRYQILDGELCVTPAPGTQHQTVSMNLSVALATHVRAGALGQLFAAPVDVILSDTTIVQRERVSARGIEGAPTLVVEILSPATAQTDRHTKRELYARFGVPCYWIVDPEARAIEMYGLAGGAYELGARATGDPLIVAEPFTGLTLPSIWPSATS